MPPRQRNQDEEYEDSLWNRMGPEAAKKHASRLATMTYIKLLVPILVTIFGIATPLAKQYFDYQNKQRDQRIEEQKLESEKALHMSQGALVQLTEIGQKLGEMKSANDTLTQEVANLKVKLNLLTQENDVVIAKYKKTLQKIIGLVAKYPDAVEDLFKEELEEEEIR